jgi:hypothetical protein
LGGSGSSGSGGSAPSGITRGGGATAAGGATGASGGTLGTSGSGGAATKAGHFGDGPPPPGHRGDDATRAALVLSIIGGLILTLGIVRRRAAVRG